MRIAKQDIIMQVCMLPARVTCNGCVIVTCGDVVLICTILGAGVFSIECLGFWVSGLVFSLNVGVKLAVDSQKFKCQTIVKGRKKRQKLF